MKTHSKKSVNFINTSQTNCIFSICYVNSKNGKEINTGFTPSAFAWQDPGARVAQGLYPEVTAAFICKFPDISLRSSGQTRNNP
jgi:hypothetical protein